MASPKKRFGLFAKYLSVLVPIFLLLAVPGLTAVVFFELRTHQETLSSRVGNQAARSAAAFLRHNAQSNPSLARDLLAPLAADRAFLCAEIRRQGQSDPVAAVPAKIGCLHQTSDGRLDMEIDDDGQYILTIQFSDAEITEATRLRQTLTILVVVCAFLFATVAAALCFRQIVTRPLQKMVLAIRRNADSGERVPVEVSSSDELGVVALAYNDLLDREIERERALKETNRALHLSQDEFKRLNAHLEERVRTRTAELHARGIALSDSEQRFRDFAKASSDWYWEMDEDLRFSYFSDRFTQVTGVDVSMLLGKTREETGVPDVDPDQWRRHLDALHNRRPFRNFIHPRKKTDGSTVWLSINGVPYTRSDGRFMGFRGTGNDITELVEARREAESASRAKSDFLANVSHELRTPLNAIIGYSELLREEARDSEDRQLLEDLFKIDNAGRQLLELVNDILDISKIEANMMEASFSLVSLDTLLDEVADIMKPAVAEKRNTLCIQNNADQPTLFTDSQKLRQILLNLLSNAAKFTNEGDIRLSVDRDGDDCLYFRVSDTGVGMSDDQLAKVFEPFVQGESSTSKKYGGTGLGLALSKRFATLLGGRLEAESREGVGSKFTVILPTQQVERPKPKEAIAS